MSIRYEICPKEGVQFHEYANLFPMLTGEAFDAFVDDISQNGVQQPIVMLGNAILDGRNRYLAARQIGIEYPVTDYEGADPLAFVVSHNLARRHLSESQRAMVAKKLETLKHGRPGKDANLHVKRSDAADLLNVSERSIASAGKVQSKGDGSLIEAVESGAVSVSAAADVAELPKPEQAEIVAKGEAEILDAAKRIRAQKAEARRADNIKGGNYRTITTGENEWYTPAEYIDLARKVLGAIDLDPASCAEANEIVRADRFYTKEDDGLAKSWEGRVWLNPPYSRDLMPAFVATLSEAYRSGSVPCAIMVSHNNTDTNWFHEIAPISAAICFPSKRIKFYRGEDIAGPVNGQMFIYLGDDPHLFVEHFSDVGFVVFPA